MNCSNIKTGDIMKRISSIVLCVALFLVATILVLSTVVIIFDSVDDYYPMTRLLPMLFNLCLAIVSILLALMVLKVQKIKFKHIIVVSAVAILLIVSIKPLNNLIINGWQKHIKLTYHGTEIEPITKTTKIKYNLQNITNNELKDVVVVFSCKGIDKDGNTAFWDAEYETYRDIPPNNDIDISVMTVSLEIEDYDYWESQVKFIAFD